MKENQYENVFEGMLDSHAHVHSCLNSNGDFIKRARENGVNRILNIFEYRDKNLFDEVLKTNILNEENIENDLLNKNLMFAAGVHPLEVIVENNSIKDFDNMQEWLKNVEKNICFFGETGLDLKKSSNKIEQLQSYEFHVEMGLRYNKGVIIHSRECEVNDLIELTKVKSIWHSFAFGSNEARRVLNLNNSFLSFSGMVTFKNAHIIREALDYCPINRLLIETDCPFLSPEPIRGKQNEPSFIKHTYEFIANFKNIKLQTLIDQVNENFNLLIC
jgi:TatD DNase family protein